MSKEREIVYILLVRQNDGTNCNTLVVEICLKKISKQMNRKMQKRKGEE
jgi:hypothetical protein